MTMIGIDPHKATHTAVAIDDNEVVLDEFKLRASTTRPKGCVNGPTVSKRENGRSSRRTVLAISLLNS